METKSKQKSTPKKPNLWMYSTDSEMRTTAASLMIFGASVFKSAKLVRDIELLNQLYLGRNNGAIAPNDERFSEFFFEHLTDNIKIVIFFENYMKAELICKSMFGNLVSPFIRV